MNTFGEFIQQYGATILYTVITAILGYLGITIKNLISKYLNDKTKREVVKACVRATEQMFKELHGEEKVEKVIEYATDILLSKGIEISASEVRVLLEQFVQEMNAELNKDVVVLQEETQQEKTPLLEQDIYK